MIKTLSSFPALLYILTSSLLLSGCDKADGQLKPEKLVAISSETVLGRPNAELSKSIKIELLSKPEPGVLGGKGEPHPLSGVKLVAKVEKGSTIKVTPQERTTDLGGCVEFDVRLGNAFADEFVEIALADDPSIKKKIRFVTGADQELEEVEARVRQVRQMTYAAIERHVTRLMQGCCTPERGIVFVELMGRLQSIARHYGNIAERAGPIRQATE